MPPPMGGVERGGRSRDLSLTDIAAISGSCVSYIFTNLANLRTPRKKGHHYHMNWSQRLHRFINLYSTFEKQSTK